MSEGKMPNTFDVRVTSMDAEMEFGVEVEFQHFMPRDRFLRFDLCRLKAWLFRVFVEECHRQGPLRSCSPYHWST